MIFRACPKLAATQECVHIPHQPRANTPFLVRQQMVMPEPNAEGVNPLQQTPFKYPQKNSILLKK